MLRLSAFYIARLRSYVPSYTFSKLRRFGESVRRDDSDDSSLSSIADEASARARPSWLSVGEGARDGVLSASDDDAESLLVEREAWPTWQGRQFNRDVLRSHCVGAREALPGIRRCLREFKTEPLRT